MIMLVKDLTIKLLVSGDKSGRVILETTTPDQVAMIAQLAEEIEVDVDFNLTTNK